MKEFFITLDEPNFSCKSVRELRKIRSQSLTLHQRKIGFLMTLRASLLRDLQNPNLSVSDRAERCCELAQDFENKGEYEEARKILGDYWRRIGEHPKLTGLERTTSAEVLLRAGVLTGFIGSKNQIPEAQEKAKDLHQPSTAGITCSVSGDRKALSCIGGGPSISGHGWGHDRRSTEHDLIKLALEQANGSVTVAARNLGISYPALNYMLNTRHKDLLKYRTPVRRRPRK